MMTGGRIAGAVLELQGERLVVGLDKTTALLTTGQEFAQIFKNGEA
jgi:hypothetical protein